MKSAPLPRRALTLATVTIALCSIAVLSACERSEPAPEPIRAVRTMTVGTDTVAGVHEYAAEIRARTESKLGFRVGGKVVRRAVNLGDPVHPGQVLAQLDPQDLRLGQQAAVAALQAAQVNADQASSDYKRFKELRDQGFISSADLERRETTLKAATAQLAQAKAQAEAQGNQAAYANLVADSAGVVVGVDAEVGTVVAAGQSVLRVAHDGQRDVVFSVPEDRVAILRKFLDKPGAVKARTWGGHGDFGATLREVSAAADPATRTFLAKADIGRADAKLGQTATVMIDNPPISGVTKLPLTAVFEQQGKTSVWLYDAASSTVKAQTIQVAGADGNSVVVSAGLAPGQIVVTAGVHVLTPGQKVKLYQEPAAAQRTATSN